MGIELCLWRQRFSLFIPRPCNRDNCQIYEPTNSFAKGRTTPLWRSFSLYLFLLCSSWIIVLASLQFCNQDFTVTPVQLTCKPRSTSHANQGITQVTLTSQHTSSTVSFLLQCMDVVPIPGPQHINISDLPTSSKLLFNQAKRTRLKLTRYLSHPINFLAYTNNNLIPKGLTPKCTPAIHSNNPSFWNKWQENLDILAKLQLDLLLKETNNNVTQLQSTFLKQKEELRTSLNHDSTYAKLVAIIETMAFKLQLNLDKLRDKKLNNELQSKNNTTHPAPCIRQSTEANNLNNTELTIP